MKGVVFTEYLSFVEQVAGADVVDDMIDASDLASGGSYTSVGKYDYNELVSMVVALSKITGASVPDLVQAFGHHLFGRFALLYPQFFEGTTGAFEFLHGVEDRIHVEVLKLYPDAELPTIKVEQVNDQELNVEYASCRPFGDLCMGLIRGCGSFYGETLDMTHQSTSDGMTLRVTRQAAEAA